MEDGKISLQRNGRNKQRPSTSSNLPKIKRSTVSSSSKELQNNSSSSKAIRPSSSDNIGLLRPKISVSDLLDRTVEKVQSTNLSYKNVQPSLLASNLAERPTIIGDCSIAPSQSVRSRYMESDSITNFSFDTARLSSRTPRALVRV
jgi:hypothetical protein